MGASSPWNKGWLGVQHVGQLNPVLYSLHVYCCTAQLTVASGLGGALPYRAMAGPPCCPMGGEARWDAWKDDGGVVS